MGRLFGKRRGPVGAGAVVDVGRGCLHRHGVGRSVRGSSGHTPPRAVQAPPPSTSPLPPLLPNSFPSPGGANTPSRPYCLTPSPSQGGASTPSLHLSAPAPTAQLLPS